MKLIIITPALSRALERFKISVNDLTADSSLIKNISNYDLQEHNKVSNSLRESMDLPFRLIDDLEPDYSRFSKNADGIIIYLDDEEVKDLLEGKHSSDKLNLLRLTAMNYVAEMYGEEEVFKGCYTFISYGF